MRKFVLLTSMWDLITIKTPSAPPQATVFRGASLIHILRHSLLSKLYIGVSTSLFSVLRKAEFGSDSQRRHSVVIHKQLHQDK